ncbi:MULTISPECIES: TetR/AcrR family transcriptional regulator [unclassified Streptomyces]|uniref:TetR/AcrR family transcriptional regulator n=1 Tax=unclassified Streptomyces TaxID=2593676 RepID=UPI001F03B4B5|nr:MULTISPECIES: TetR/AcrR family transcriptional regulator [unclassified Streptomyces]MCH0564452.1 TetR/AcrR family transcriptional regulator [Streptomyces sp. MUM 2J]MCH0569335.1 TetR/AcrR family transcriptional regulator [Streptomyces sp. MUM 136J]
MPRVSAAYRAARRDHILAAASTCFARDGFHRATIQDVIDEAGMSPGAVYRYFRTKDEIIAAISLDATAMVETAVRDALRTRQPLPALFARLPRTLAALDHADDRFRLAVQAWGEALRNPTLAAAMQHGLRGVHDALRERIAQGQAEGEVAAAVHPAAAAGVLLSLLQGFILQTAWQSELSADVYGDAASAVIAGQLSAGPAD